MIWQQRVLVVCNSLRRREQLRELLRSRKWRSVEVSDLASALEQTATGRFGCAIVDADLTWTLQSRIVAALKAVDRRIDIVVASNSNSTEQEMALRQQPVFYYFVRGANGGDEDELLLAVAHALKCVRGNITALAGSVA